MSRDIEREVRERYAERRERIATAVLAGLYANPDPRLVGEGNFHTLAGWAVEAADALLSALTAASSRDALRAIELKRKTESEVTA